MLILFYTRSRHGQNQRGRLLRQDLKKLLSAVHFLARIYSIGAAKID